jgi:hypothetical protein
MNLSILGTLGEQAHCGQLRSVHCSVDGGVNEEIIKINFKEIDCNDFN